jgi:Cu-Zn family superoxide dismutase
MGMIPGRKALFGMVVVLTGLAMFSGPSAGASAEEASAILRDANGIRVGRVTLTEVRSSAFVKTAVTATARGLSPGFHGFHVHTVGTCTPPDFMSAGGHYNPAGANHPNHAGDGPSLLVNSDGSAALGFLTDRYQIEDLFDADGSAFIVHALPDNFANIPPRYAPNGPDAMTLATGDSGARVACGVVEQT